MWNIIAKFILVATSFAPLLCAIAIDSISKPWRISVIYLFVAGIVLGIVCWAMMKFASNKGATSQLYIKEFNRRDQGTLLFLFIYLLPFIRSPDSSFDLSWSTVIIFGIIIFTMIDLGGYNFNPVMRLFGYRFYEVKDRKDVRCLLITQTDLQRLGIEVQTRRISHDVYVQTEGN